MAKTAINVNISSTGPTTYTVPSGYYFCGKAFSLDAGTAQVAVNGVIVARLITLAASSTGTGEGSGPMQANAGDVYSCPNGSYGLSGWLFSTT